MSTERAGEDTEIFQAVSLATRGGGFQLGLVSEPFAWLGMVALNEIAGSGALFPFELDFQEFQRAVLRAAHKQSIAHHAQLRRRIRFR